MSQIYNNLYLCKKDRQIIKFTRIILQYEFLHEGYVSIYLVDLTKKRRKVT